MGRAEDYMDDDLPEPSEKIWKSLLSVGSTWEQFKSIQQDDYVFVDDGLQKLAPILGMDSKNILFNAEYAEDYENTCFLYFKKVVQKRKQV